MLRRLRNATYANGESGASAVEYGLLIAAIAAVIVIVIFALGGLVRDLFSQTCSTISAQPTVGGDCTS